MVTYPSLIQEQLELVIGNAQPLSRELLTYLSEAQETLQQEFDAGEARNLKIALTKIRKLTGRHWDQWDGWIPIRDVDVTRVSDQELFENCIDDLGNPLHLGQTLRTASGWKIVGSRVSSATPNTGPTSVPSPPTTSMAIISSDRCVPTISGERKWKKNAYRLPDREASAALMAKAAIL